MQSVFEVERVASLAETYQINQRGSHNLMLGALVSPSTISGSVPTLTNKPCRHVVSKELLVDIIRATQERSAIGMVHFELHKEWPGTQGDAASVISLLTFLERNGALCPVQLNGVILPHEIMRIRSETGAPIVLQLRKEISNRPLREVLAYIDSVASAVSKILMDPSAGAGESLSIDSAMSLYREIEKRFPGVFRFGFAGGLGGAEQSERQRTTETVQALRVHIQSGEFSVDSETKVRRLTSKSGEDLLDIDLCAAYLEAVQAGFQSTC